jgi:hypothetical protein|tara:strand:- start:7400 stop:7723 length:324 start_codon:yes stop_codon:yes gene_type:complete
VAAVVWDITAIGKDVNTQLLTAVCDRAVHDALQLIVPRVNATGAEKGDDVQRVGRKRGFDVLPARVGEEGAFEGDIDQSRSLRDNFTSAESVVTNLETGRVSELAIG